MTQPCLLPKSASAKRVAAIMHRQPTTRWTENEVRKFKKLQPFDEEELLMIERYYKANWPPRWGVNVLRTTLEILLNHWSGEVDRGRIWCARHPLPSERKVRPSNGHLPAPEPEPIDPETLASFRKAFAARTGKELYQPIL